MTDPITYSIAPYNDEYRTALLGTWEQSVLATHHFLSDADFQLIKSLVYQFNFNDLNVHCLLHNSHVAGFIGLSDTKIEMLFLSPVYTGRRLGQLLIQFAIANFNANLVDVNEQNENAVAFYKKMGFETYERTEKDDQGNDYPLLRMKLKSPQ